MERTKQLFVLKKKKNIYMYISSFPGNGMSLSTESGISRSRPENWGAGATMGERFSSLCSCSPCPLHTEQNHLFESLKAKKRPCPVLPSYSPFLAIIWCFLFVDISLVTEFPSPSSATRFFTFKLSTPRMWQVPI